MANQGYVNWTHPSCRDLVIEEITQNKEFGLRFLCSATLDGIKLAISDTGGAEGDRVHPLMNFPESWDVMRERCLMLVEASDLWNTSQLIKAVTSSLKRITPGDLRIRFEGLLQSIITKARQKWDAGEIVLLPYTLSLYYEATIVISPLPPSPFLTPTWDCELESTRTALREFGETEEEETGDPRELVDALETWGNLCNVIKVNEPRFLMQVGFPDLFTREFDEILDMSGQVIERICDMVSAEEKRQWARLLDDLADVIEKIFVAAYGKYNDKFKGAKATMSRLRTEAADLRGEAEEIDPPEVDTDKKAQPSKQVIRVSFDIEALFADL